MPIRLAKYRATITVYSILFLTMLVTSLFSDVFSKARNIESILQAATSVGIVAIGQTFTILVGGIDLSVGSVVSLTTCLAAGIINGRAELLVPVIVLVILLSLLIGFCNGILVTKVGVHPIIVTLGMMAIIQGGALIYAEGPIGGVPESFNFFAWGSIGYIPCAAIILGAVSLVGIFVLKKTVFGRYVYATGGGDEVARLSGVNTDKVKICAYMICSLCASLCGLYLVSRMAMGDPTIGSTFMFDSIIPVLLGGTAFSGGKGGIVGTIGGVFFFTVLNNAMNLFDVLTYWQWVVSGMVMLCAVVIYAKRE